MIADRPQRAIFDDSARYHRFLEYRVSGEAERGRAARAVALALHAARDSVDRPARIVVAFGRRLWSVLAPGSIPPDLRDFETIEGVDGHVAPATQCDVWVWLQGDGEDENVAIRSSSNGCTGSPATGSTIASSSFRPPTPGATCSPPASGRLPRPSARVPGSGENCGLRFRTRGSGTSESEIVDS